MTVIGYEVTDKRGRKRIIEAGGPAEQNDRMRGESLAALIYQGEAIPCASCADTIARHGLEAGGAVIKVKHNA